VLVGGNRKLHDKHGTAGAVPCKYLIGMQVVLARSSVSFGSGRSHSQGQPCLLAAVQKRHADLQDPARVAQAHVHTWCNACGIFEDRHGESLLVCSEPVRMITCYSCWTRLIVRMCVTYEAILTTFYSLK